MEKISKKRFFEIALVTLAVFFIAMATFAIFSTSRIPSRYFSFGGYSVEDGKQAWTANVYELTDLGSSDDDRVYHSVWISFAGIDYTEGVETVTIRASRATSKTSSFSQNTNTKAEFKNDAKSLNVGGWLKLYDYGEEVSTTPYFIIATRNQIKINEIVFIGEEDGVLSKLSATAIGSGFAGTTDGSWATKFSGSGISKLEEDIARANRLVDEQKLFDVSLIKDGVYNEGKKDLFDGELSLLTSINGLGDGKANVDYTANPLGLYILLLGKIIFGGNAIGMRFICLLFIVGSMILLYALGLKLFREKSYALILSSLFAISGYAFSYAVIANVSAIMTFFVLLAFYFSVRFSQKKNLDKNDRGTFFNIFLSGLGLALALAVKSQAIFFIPVILAPIVSSLIGVRKTEQGKQACSFGALICLFSFLLLPVVILVAVYGLGANLYALENSIVVFEYGIKHFLQCLNTGFGSGVGYIINNGKEYVGDGRFALANVVLTFSAIVSIIYLAYVVFKILTKGDKTKTYVLPKTFLFVVLGYLGSYLLSLIFVASPATYALTNVFGVLAIVVAYRYLDKIYKKPLLAIGNTNVTIVRIAGACVLIASIVAFAIGLPVWFGF